MAVILTLLLLAASPHPAAPVGPDPALTQEPTAPAAPATERIELRKDGGPGHGPDQPYNIREVGAQDLERFIGGKQVVMVAPYDWLLLLLLVVVVVVLIIAL